MIYRLSSTIFEGESFMEEKKKAAFRLGWMVLVALAVLTGLEYWVAINWESTLVTLFVIALIKAWAIIKYFMHVATLWSEEGGH